MRFCCEELFVFMIHLDFMDGQKEKRDLCVFYDDFMMRKGCTKELVLLPVRDFCFIALLRIPRRDNCSLSLVST